MRRRPNLPRWLLTAVVTVPLAISAVHAEPRRTIAVNGVWTRIHVENLEQLRERGVMRQGWDWSCGAASLGTVLDYYYGRRFSELTIVLSMLKNGDAAKVRAQGGFSLLDLKRFADAVGFRGEGYAELTLHDLQSFHVPVIVPVSIRGFPHFVVFRFMLGDRVVVGDPAFGNLTLTTRRFLRIWASRIGFVVLRGPHSPRRHWTPLGPKIMALPVPRLLDVGRRVSGVPAIPLTRLPLVIAKPGP